MYLRMQNRWIDYDHIQIYMENKHAMVWNQGSIPKNIGSILVNSESQSFEIVSRVQWRQNHIIWRRKPKHMSARSYNSTNKWNF